ncbi:MAG: UDP-N-acetylmuramoyl-L-alanyl-D-glutamate--2,6-diaminopimelate ligase [Alphaproteobacteria bacterium]
MKLNDLCGDETSLSQDATEITGLTADSREVQPGFLFAALPGTQVNGARFVTDAVTRGASAILAPEGLELDSALSVPIIRDAAPRRRLALMAARFYGRQPATCVAITGTNGKTSVASFVRQIWEAQDLFAASMGTTGIAFNGEERSLGYTTPDPVSLHSQLAGLTDRGVTHLAFEASSHGLAQHRVDGMKLAAGGFTNITRDHLDYHPSFDDYFAAKMRLFTELLAPGQPAIIDVDSQGGEQAAEMARARGLKLFTVGRNGDTLRLLSSERDGFAQTLCVSLEGAAYDVRVPLAGEFQAANALVAAGLAIATGTPPEGVFRAVEHLKGAKGRLELAGYSPKRAAVFIDYAHTPDALENAILALRSFTSGRLQVVFGCGGDRDRGKRPQMGEVAARLADHVIVTDDNPRSEDPAAIRAEILAAAPGATEIGNRTEAVSEAIAGLAEGDVLLIAGKGHETGQIVGNTVLPYSDHDSVAKVLLALGGKVIG